MLTVVLQKNISNIILKFVQITEENHCLVCQEKCVLNVLKGNAE